jgi:hypothetical protein
MKANAAANRSKAGPASELAALSPGERFDLYDELRAFVYTGQPTAPWPVGAHTGPPFQFTYEYVRDLQKELVEGFRGLLSGSGWLIQYSTPTLKPDEFIYALRRDARGRVSGSYSNVRRFFSP